MTMVPIIMKRSFVELMIGVYLLVLVFLNFASAFNSLYFLKRSQNIKIKNINPNIRRYLYQNVDFFQNRENSSIMKHGAVRDSDFEEMGVPRLSLEAIEELNRSGYVVLENWLSNDLVEELCQDIQNLRSKGKFKVAKIGQDSTNTLDTNIRVAETCFLGATKLQDVPSSSRNRLYQILEQLRLDLSGNKLLDEVDLNGKLVKAAPALDASLTELLYAYYPRGGFYRKHTDAVEGSASVLRKYSLLLYLNNQWKLEDGGCLRVHLDSGEDDLRPMGEKPQPHFVDVQPKGGTLVLFQSDRIPHEVLDTASERMAVVGWYNRPFTSADLDALASQQDKIRVGMLFMSLVLVAYGTASILL